VINSIPSLNLQVSWSKSLVRKWFNIKNKAQDFHADYDASQSQTKSQGENAKCFCFWLKD
jgi:hypothetical protein